MTLDALHVELTGGGPGLVLVRIAGRAVAPTRCRVAPPSLLIAEGGAWRRLATVAGTPPIVAGPEGPAFAVEVEVPLHLAAAEGPWWVEPGPALADPGATGSAGGPDPAALDALRARVAALGAEVAALRASVEGDAATAGERTSNGRGAGAGAVAPRDHAADHATPGGAAVDAPAGTPAGPAPKPSATAVAVSRPRLRLPRPTLPALLFATGVLAVGDAVATVVWQEPISALWAGHQQHALQSDLARLDAAFATRAPAAMPSPATPQRQRPRVRMRRLARTLERVTSTGHPLGEIRIPRIHASYVVVQGTGASSLRRGPGHYLGTPLPGEPGTVGIAGHRTTYGAPFRHIDALRRGDPIDVTMPYGRFSYRVLRLRVVKPDDVSALRDVGQDRLVLSACHPLYSAAERLLVIARLAHATPRGAARSAVAAVTAPRGTAHTAARAAAAAPATPPRRLAGDGAGGRRRQA